MLTHYQRLRKKLDLHEWQNRYTQFTANQCTGDTALATEDGYYAVPFCATYHPTGDFALVAGEYGAVLKLPFANDAPVTQLQFNSINDAIFDLEWDKSSSSSERLILASSDSHAYIWDFGKNTGVTMVKSTDMIKRAKVYQEHLLITGGASGKLEGWDLRSECTNPMISIDAHSINGKGSITSFAFSMNSIATIGTPDYRLKTWDLRMPKRPVVQIESVCSQRERAYTGVEYCPQSDSWYACNTNNRVFRFNHLGVLCDTFEAPNFSSVSFYTKLQVGKDSKSVMCTSGNGQLYLWNVESKDCVTMGNNCEIEVTAFAQSPNRDELLIACEDSSIRLWSPQNDSNEYAHFLPFTQKHTEAMDLDCPTKENVFHERLEWPFELATNNQSNAKISEQTIILEYYSNESSNAKRPRLAK